MSPFRITCPLATIRASRSMTEFSGEFKIDAGVGVLFYSSTGVLQEARPNGELW